MDMKSNWRAIFLGILMGLLATEGAFAQSPDVKPKEFYEPGYVTKTEPKNGGFNQSLGLKTPPSPAQNSKSGSNSTGRTLEAPTLTAEPAASPQYKTYKVKAVSAVISSMDKTHFESGLKELIELSQRFDLAIHDVYVPGSIENLGETSPLFFPIVARGGTISFSNIPRRYQVTLSPTWIIETGEGEIIMEATGPLAENFNDEGDFVDFPRKITEITPVPTSTPETVEDKIESMKNGAATQAASPTATPTAPAKAVNSEDGVQSF